MEESIIVKTTSVFNNVRVDAFDQDLWLHLSTRNGTCHVTLTKDQANQLIAALQTVVAVIEEQPA
jgi:hypothetical protein